MVRIITKITVCYIFTIFIFPVDSFGYGKESNALEGTPFRVAITISGGISLGAYEAGMNWALIKILKDIGREIEDDGENFLSKKPISSYVPELLAVTGSSAGGINALITTIYWFAKPGTKEDGYLPDKIFNNLFYKTWIPIGFNDLLPGSVKQYCREDGLLSRKTFFEKGKGPVCEIQDYMNKSIYDHTKKDIYLGLTLTREQPIHFDVVDLNVPIQSMKIPMQVKVSGSGQLEFRPVAQIFNEVLESYENDLGYTWKDRDRQNYISLPVDEEGREGKISYRDMTSAAMATSAFPIAFGRKTMDYCQVCPEIENEKKKQHEQQSTLDSLTDRCNCDGNLDAQPVTCPEFIVKKKGKKKLVKMSLHTTEFLDGGVFDNIPLGLTTELVDLKLNNSSVYYIFMDPNRRRAWVSDVKTNKGIKKRSGLPIDSNETLSGPKAFNLMQQGAFLSDTVLSAQSRELYEALLDYKWTPWDDKEEGHKRKLICSDRYHPITGAMLAHFGAFYSQWFRKVDYLIGVYV